MNMNEEELIELLRKNRSPGDYGRMIAEFTGQDYVEPEPPTRYQILKARIRYRLHIIKLAYQVLRRGYHEDENDW